MFIGYDLFKYYKILIITVTFNYKGVSTITDQSF
jgi:hypothetical protein